MFGVTKQENNVSKGKPFRVGGKPGFRRNLMGREDLKMERYGEAVDSFLLSEIMLLVSVTSFKVSSGILEHRMLFWSERSLNNRSPQTSEERMTPGKRRKRDKV